MTVIHHAGREVLVKRGGSAGRYFVFVDGIGTRNGFKSLERAIAAGKVRAEYEARRIETVGIAERLIAERKKRGAT